MNKEQEKLINIMNTVNKLIDFNIRINKNYHDLKLSLLQKEFKGKIGHKQWLDE